MFLVYCIEHIATKQKYVGKTTQVLWRRWAEHRYEARAGRKESSLYTALRTHGADAFYCYTLEEARDSQDLRKKERKWIRKLKTESEGLNDRWGGGGRTRKLQGRRCSWDEETKQKIRTSMLATMAAKRAREDVSFETTSL